LIKQDNSGTTPSSSASSSSTSSRSSSTSSTSSRTSYSPSSSSSPAPTGRAINPNNDKTKCLQVRGTPANDARVEYVTFPHFYIAPFPFLSHYINFIICLMLLGKWLTCRISDCNNSANQRWTLVKGSTSVKLAGSNFCLDAGGSPANGAQAKIYTVSRLVSKPPFSIIGLSSCRRRCQISDDIEYDLVADDSATQV
jgi:hypothetical protein